MNLHEDKDAFSELVITTAERIGLPQVYVEKDYWLTRALKHLSESAHNDLAVFKGGTSLSKAYRLITRFSEDVDLAVLSEGVGNSVTKKRLKRVESAAATGLTCIADDPRQQKGSKYRKTVYQYPREVEGEDFGQASPELLLEVNAFTEPEPFAPMELETIIAEVLRELGNDDLIEHYGLETFSVNVLSVKRTLVEKILRAIKDSHADDPQEQLSVKIRHLYDICLILRSEEHRNFIASEDFDPLCQVCIQSEKNGVFTGAEHLEKTLSEAPLFIHFSDWKSALEKTYREVFADLVYGELPDMDEIEESLQFIRSHI